MTHEIVKRILIAVISTVLFSISLAIFVYTPASNREPDSSYNSLLGLFTIYALFSGPVFVIAGIIWSFIFDKISRKYLTRSKRYFTKFILYIIAGLGSTVIFLFIISNGKIISNTETFSFLLLGIIASLLYYHLLIIWQFLFKK
ncbi:hypothetical protein OR571_18840 [Psychrobacillus sp. NEAU-3TGS]|uniref:hypothetical protein n=1 Tax=Psychrobacillus sp. NEAU-3TGS TaxID=2995412 RepID=UPI0024961EF5|nr:hypothetical protein [Psychrobacillus sp. NEAU-3TGS]MDI2589098.1 hypothetical protein [Psychrobacillus sp. NEAU-3TGS]